MRQGEDRAWTHTRGREAARLRARAPSRQVHEQWAGRRCCDTGQTKGLGTLDSTAEGATSGL